MSIWYKYIEYAYNYQTSIIIVHLKKYYSTTKKSVYSLFFPSFKWLSSTKNSFLIILKVHLSEILKDYYYHVYFKEEFILFTRILQNSIKEKIDSALCNKRTEFLFWFNILYWNATRQDLGYIWTKFDQLRWQICGYTNLWNTRNR